MKRTEEQELMDYLNRMDEELFRIRTNKGTEPIMNDLAECLGECHWRLYHLMHADD